MLIIPTSLDTAIILESAQPQVWAALGYLGFTCGAYCLWEMLMAALLGRGPTATRWRLLATAAALLAIAALSSLLMFGPVTFNGDGAEWVSTSWGLVVAQWCMAAFVACVAALLVQRAVDAARARRSGGLPYLAWWLLGLGMMAAYGLLLTADAWLPDSGATGTPSLAGAFVLGCLGAASLIATAVIKRMRFLRLAAGDQG